MRTPCRFWAAFLLFVCGIALLASCGCAQAFLNPYTVVYNESNTLQLVVLRSHCVVIDLDMVLTRRVGSMGTIIFDGEAAHGELSHGDIEAGQALYATSQRWRQRTLLKQGSSLDYGFGTITYCPSPLNATTQHKATREVEEMASVNDSIPLRFMPTPVTREHPVQHHRLLLTIAPLTFAPVAPTTTAWVDGWAWVEREDEAGDADQKRVEDEDDADDDDEVKGDGLLFDTDRLEQTDDTAVLPIAIGPRAELRPHWRHALPGDLIRYTLRPTAGDNDTLNVTLPKDVEPGLEALEMVELFSLDGRASLAPCVLYFVEEGNVAATTPPINEDAGEEEEQREVLTSPEEITDLPFSFPPTAQIRFRVDMTRSEVAAAMQDWMLSTTADTNVSAEPPPLCAVGYRARQRGSGAFTPAGEVRVAWTPAPRAVIAAANITVPPVAHVEREVFVTAHTAKTHASASAFEMKELCWVAPTPEIPHLTIAEQLNRRCVPCVQGEPTCTMQLLYNNTAANVSAAAGNGTAAVKEDCELPSIDVVGSLRFYTVSAHKSLAGTYTSASTQVAVRVLPLALISLYFRHLPGATYVVRLNRTADVPAVVDVAAAVPAVFRPHITAVTLDAASLHGLRGELQGRAVAPASLSEAQRGLQWRRLRRHTNLSLNTTDGRGAWVMREKPTLLRYVPPASWFASPTAGCAAAATASPSVDRTVDDAVSVRVDFAFDFSAAFTLVFRMEAKESCQQADAQPPIAITTHMFVHRHTANPLRLPLPQREAAAGTNGVATRPPRQSVRFVSLPLSGTLSRAPSCYSTGDEEARRFLGHCDAAPKPLDVDVGCVCCWHNCSAYVGPPLSAGTVVEEEPPVDATRAEDPSLLVFYTPPPSPSRGAGAAGKEEELAVIRYNMWSVQQQAEQQYEVVLHVREWPDAAVRPAFMLPLAGGSRRASPLQPQPSRNVFSVLRMSTRSDVETGLVGSAHGNVTAWFPWKVYECVAVDDAVPPVYARTERPLQPKLKSGVRGYWPSLTRGCLVLESSGDLPLLVVHAVKTSDSGVAATTVKLQPYAVVWSERAAVAWTPQVEGESPDWIIAAANASGAVRIVVPSPWGFVPPRQDL